MNRLFECFNIKMAMVKEMLASFKTNKKVKKQKGVDFKKIVLSDAK